MQKNIDMFDVRPEFCFLFFSKNLKYALVFLTRRRKVLGKFKVHIYYF